MSGLRARLRDALGFAPTPRLAALVAALASVWLLSGTRIGVVIALVASGALLAAVVLDIALLPAARDLDVHRELPETLGVGDAETGSYRVDSRWGRPLLVTVHDALPPVLTAAPPAERDTARSVPVAPFQSVSLPFDVLPRQRGEQWLGDVALRVRTPLGLVLRTLRYRRDDRVVVAPSLAGVRRLRWLVVHERLAAAGVRATRRLGEGRSFARLRDYVVGDDPRHIDWKATARRGHPITREFTLEQAQTMYILVDAGRSMTQLSGAFPRFEYALSSALVLADVAVRAGDRVGAMVFDDQLRALVPAQRGLAALQALRTALVPLQPTLVEPDYSAAFRVLARRQRKRALLVLLTDVIDARAARALLAHFSRGASRHLAVVVALRNEALVAATVLPAAGAAASTLFLSAAAEELVSERAVALQRMRDAGIVVLDVEPRAMAAAVVSRYLELKTRGAL